MPKIVRPPQSKQHRALVKIHQGLVHNLAKEFYKNNRPIFRRLGMVFMDVKQEFEIEALHAAQAFDPNHGNKFGAFLREYCKRRFLQLRHESIAKRHALEYHGFVDRLSRKNSGSLAGYSLSLESLALKNRGELLEVVNRLERPRKMMFGPFEKGKKVFVHLWGLEDGQAKTLDETAAHFGISRPNVGQISQRFIGLLRERFGVKE